MAICSCVCGCVHVTGLGITMMFHVMQHAEVSLKAALVVRPSTQSANVESIVMQALVITTYTPHFVFVQLSPFTGPLYLVCS